ncbi:hypothetical protein EDM56_03615 [Brevibacillus fluminis]|uniref:Aminodeoxychorismate lyase n=1 Tax=Brevibacillus fluminis TaxID=511487 RepID=A0A3M8DUJ6_9BACL|nr:hypothetical protein [Brevibacillus fluminis]RNB91850.1 hypothetical protein EDM56_03615 [Brevibacillus fluminis]
MSSRSFLYGLGSGLIVAAAVMWFYPALPGQKALTQEELASIAQQKQLVLVPKAEYDKLKNTDKSAAAPAKAPVSPTAPQTQAPKQPAAGDATPSTQLGQPLTPVQPATQAGKAPDTTAPSKPDSASAAPQVTQPTAQEPQTTSPASPEIPVELVTVRIPGATNATAAGKLLADAGLIQSADQLVNALRAAGKLDRIRANTYQIPKGTSIDDIVKRITTPPKK